MPPRLARNLCQPIRGLARTHPRTSALSQRRRVSSAPDNEVKKSDPPPQPAVKKGSLAPTSPFYHTVMGEDALSSTGSTTDTPSSTTNSEADRERDLAAGMITKLDPNPLARRRWERKMVIRDILSNGYVPRDIQIKRSERESTNKSELWRTSMKKLQPLATQIAGKTIEEAIVQMRFSKKKVAKNVLEHLELARDQAIVERGMGLGTQTNPKANAHSLIRLKDGTRHKVTDQTGIYIEQAWVGKGPYGMTTNARAKGRVDVLRLPQTSLTVLLKEEKTRVRQHMERVAREKRKRVWVQHADRPIDGQRQYFTW